MLTEPLDEAALNAIEARANAATAGPWVTSGPDTIGEWCVYGAGWMVASTTPNGGIKSHQANCNAVFIASARTDVPLLVARVRALEAELAALKGE